MIRRYLGFIAIFVLLLSLEAVPQIALSNPGLGDVDSSRAKILAYLLRQQLPRYHFSHKALDDDLSRAAFDLYLKQIDSQKRLLLIVDVNRLRQFEASIDDEIAQSDLTMPVLVRDILSSRIEWVRKTVNELLDAGFDFDRHEYILTDPEKLEFCRTEDELRERWRKILKLQVINRYLSLEEDALGDKAPATGTSDDGAEVPKPQTGNKEDQPDEKPSSPEALRLNAIEKVRKSFQEYFERLQRETVKDQYDRFFDAVARAYDPHTNYMPPATKEDFDIGLRGSLEGIGATLRQEDGYVIVVRIIPGSAAYRQGALEAEDVILKVAEGLGEPVDITDMSLRDAVGLIRGKKGTEVRLTVKKPDGSQTVIPIVRDVVEIEETFVKYGILESSPSGRSIGYIKIPSFYRDFESSSHPGGSRNSTDDVRSALETLKENKIEGIVLDLRNDGGGSLLDAIQITGLFIDQGPVVQVRDSMGRIQIREDGDPGVSYDGPLIVLVNRFSASASEILAGALQDYGRAILVGSSHTHGKGTVQTMVDLDQASGFPNMEAYKPLGALKVTIQKFYRVSGASTQYRGVLPDIVLPDLMEYMETGEQYLDYSLPWDTVQTASYTRWSVVPPTVETLAAHSASRVKNTPAFSRIREQAEQSKQRREKALQSLHIDTIRKEREEEREGRKQIGDGFSGHGDRQVPDAKKNLTEAEKKKLWIQELQEDPYVTEAMAVLGDLLAPTETAKVPDRRETVAPP